MTLSTKVDGILIVTRMKVVRRAILSELARQLSSVPTRVLGFILTGAGEEDGYGYGHGYGYGGAYVAQPEARSKRSTRERTEA
jgi:Mrp family chromosome partitioning ATPase